VKALVRLYPKSWRRRYGREMEELVDELGSRPTVAVDLILGAGRAYAAVIRGNRILSTGGAFLHGLCVTVLVQAIAFVTVILFAQNTSQQTEIQVGPFTIATISRSELLYWHGVQLHSVLAMVAAISWLPAAGLLLALVVALGSVLVAPRWLLRPAR